MVFALQSTIRSVGKYQLVAELGKGGMAEVYLAVVRGPAGFVKLHVLKRLKADLALDSDFHTMFLDEARLAARLDHPNIVHTIEVQLDEGLPFIAMEYIDGESLYALWRACRDRGGQLPIEVVCRILCDALAGLQHAHDARDFDGTPMHIVHRDITPHNILVSYDGHVKVVDFGIAKARITSSQTASGVIKGKITYLSPEQAKGEVVDRRSDVFSVGVMLFEALTGRRMWGDLVDYQILTRLATGDIPVPSGKEPNVSPQLLRICCKALATDPEDRYFSAAAFQEALEQFLETSKLRVMTKTVGGVVADLFREKRTAMREVIERELAAVDQGMAFRPLPRFGSYGRLRPHTQSEGTLSLETSTVLSHPQIARSIPTTGGITSTPDGVAVTPRRRGYSILGIAAAMLVLAAATSGIFALSHASLSIESPPAIASTRTNDLVSLSMSAVPADAKLSIDGVKVDSNPYASHVVRDDKDHVVRVEADGYEPKTIRVGFSNDVALRIKLEPKPASSASGVSSQEAGSDAAADAPARPPRPRWNRPKDQRPLDMDDPWN